jgi:hypothetical protein
MPRYRRGGGRLCSPPLHSPARRFSGRSSWHRASAARRHHESRARLTKLLRECARRRVRRTGGAASGAVPQRS